LLFTPIGVGTPPRFTSLACQGNYDADGKVTGVLPLGVWFPEEVEESLKTHAGVIDANVIGVPDEQWGSAVTAVVSLADGATVKAPDGKSLTLTVDGAPTITSAAGATFAEGSAGSLTVTTTGTPTAALSESGSLPGGVTFVDNGDGTATLAGTPATGSNGVYPLTITASNGVSPNATQSFTLTVDASPFITSGDNTTFSEGSVGDFTVTTTGTPTAAITEHGHLPAGITFTDFGDGSAGLSGTPAPGSNGVYSLNIQADNGLHPKATQTFTLTVNAPPVFTSAASTTFQQNGAGSFTVTTTGDPTPNLIEFGTLPGGISFRDNGNGSGTLSGTSSAVGTFQFFFGASNGVGPQVVQEFTLTMGGLRITTTSLPLMSS